MIQLSRIATIVPASFPLPGPFSYRRYALVDRGSYEYCDDVTVPPELVALASEVTSRTLEVVSARLVRLSPGDYVLAHHDHTHDDHRVEVIVDMSPAAVPGTEVRYRRRGAVFFRFPSAPGATSIVERDSATQCHHTYVSKLAAGASVVRLIVLLRDAAVPV
ncbi:MAG: hypothetical protein IPQ07_13665 [Myxococcales bacterium]|nr:hypothetical protein [Myxococcales bacterium]